MGAEDPTDVLTALDELRPVRGVPKSTCQYLEAADPALLEKIREAFRRGNSHTSIASTMKKAGATVTLPGIRDHYRGDCETCRISLRS